MLKVFAAGRVGQDAKHTTTQGGTDICSFSLACDVGFGDNKQTVWLDVAKFGKGAEGLTRYVKKGNQLTVSGSLSLREHEGRTYLKVQADDIALQGGNSGNQRTPDGSQGSPPDNGGGYDDMDDSIPFITSEGAF
jgi:single-strand DNA-binding protein